MPPPALTNPQRNHLMNLLCACDAIADQGTRELIVRQLRDGIRHNITRHPALRADVANIVQRCVQYQGGLEELVQAIYAFESDSIPMQTLVTWLRIEVKLTIDLPLPAPAPVEPSDPTASSPAPRGNPAPQPSAPRPPPGPVRQRWALLVGINVYNEPSYAPLRYCVNDVRALATQLAGGGYTVVALHDELDPKSHRFPSRENVEAELRSICESAAHDDFILVFFACHGLLRDGQRWLALQNTRARSPHSALALAEVEAMLRASKANRCLLLLDACHVGIEIGRSMTDPDFLRHSFELAEGFAVLAASTSQQIAREWHAVKHGVFSYYLLDGLEGAADRDHKGFVTVDDLKNHVIDGLRRWNVEQGMPLQEPNARIEGIGDIIVVDRRS
ncbi:caspase family protein [Candidatus Chloroploca sp. Khr17]|uniref:effector-associated domain 2-containing protein n=1 Tax=Candidatus Chloroploca sp. Khr17 TaxID=2496869 RepID=UPI00101C2F6C|nr:caspase family protein [Candidatus Chloroploca sp. Khr17]